jgi:hypothetical protein
MEESLHIERALPRALFAHSETEIMS